MRDPDEATDGPTDPRVHPEESPDSAGEPDGLEDIEVSRDVTTGDASPRELQATDTAPRAAPDRRRREDRGPRRRRSRRAPAGCAGVGEGRPTRPPRRADRIRPRGRRRRRAPVRSRGARRTRRRARRRSRGRGDDDPTRGSALAVVALDRIAGKRARADHRDGARRRPPRGRQERDGPAVQAARRGAVLRPAGAVARGQQRLREWAVHLLAGVDDERAHPASTRSRTTRRSRKSSGSTARPARSTPTPGSSGGSSAAAPKTTARPTRRDAQPPTGPVNRSGPESATTPTPTPMP